MPDAPFSGNFDDPVRRFPLRSPSHGESPYAPLSTLRQLAREEVSRELHHLAEELRSLRAEQRRD